MAKAKSAGTVRRDSARDERVAEVEQELEQWRARAIPDPNAPLDADDLARLVRACFDAMGVDASAGESFSVNTVHFYRRKDILDEPEGRTSAARYALRHVWQAAGARLAGYLGLVTLAEAKRRIRGADVNELRRFVAERVADARGRNAARVASVEAPRPLVASRARASSRATATVVPLGGNALCLIPTEHEALRSPAAARALVEALAAALSID